jgi:hypothetical protein
MMPSPIIPTVLSITSPADQSASRDGAVVS